jgi:hypothetical protein
MKKARVLKTRRVYPVLHELADQTVVLNFAKNPRVDEPVPVVFPRTDIKVMSYSKGGKGWGKK